MKLFLKIGLLNIFVVLIYACSKDRLIPNEDPFKDKEFENTYNMPLFSKLASKSQKITVKNANDLPIITKKGTKLWLYNENLLTAQYNAPQYPFDLEIIELYTFAEMILHRKSTVSYSQILTTGGAIYLNVSKNGVNLSVNSYSPPQIEIPAKTVDNSMYLFYQGYDNMEQFTWVAAPKDTIRQTIKEYPLIIGGKNAYEIFPRQFGWINCDKFSNYTGTKTRVKFTSGSPALENIVIFMVFPNISSVIQVYNGESLEVPVGEDAKIVAVAQTKDGQIFSFFLNIKVEEKQTIEVNLTDTTEKEFLAALEKL
jgi:hypothetical protein